MSCSTGVSAVSEADVPELHIATGIRHRSDRKVREFGFFEGGLIKNTGGDRTGAQSRKAVTDPEQTCSECGAQEQERAGRPARPTPDDEERSGETDQPQERGGPVTRSIRVFA